MTGMISNTLYARYHEERSGAKILECEDGFLVYRITGEECFIVDMYIAPEKRKSLLFKKMMDELEILAKSSGGTLITANIFIDDPGASNTLIAVLKYGFRVTGTGNGVLLVAKEIGG